jgi:hypothetical protein
MTDTRVRAVIKLLKFMFSFVSQRFLSALAVIGNAAFLDVSSYLATLASGNAPRWPRRTVAASSPGST